MLGETALRWLGRVRGMRDEDAQGMVEYGLLLGLMVVVCLAAMTNLGDSFTTFFLDVANTIDSTLSSIS